MTSEVTRRQSHSAVSRIAPYGAVLVLLLGVVVFSLLRPDSFATVENLRAILSEEAVLAFAALGITVPLIAGQFDLSIGGVIGFTGLLAVGLMSFSGLPWLLAALLGLLAGTTVGLVNGLLIAYGGIHSFVATLATGTLVYGAQLWYSRGEIIFEGIATDYVALTRTTALGFTLPVFYTVVLAGCCGSSSHTRRSAGISTPSAETGRPPRSPGYASSATSSTA